MKESLKNQAVTLWLDQGIRRLTDASGTHSMQWYAQAEYLLQLRTSDGDFTLDSNGAAPTVIASADTVAMHYLHDAAEVTVTYSLGKAEAYKTVSVTARQPLTVVYATAEIAAVHEPLSRGGEGQPLFVGERGYIASMFPTAVNQADGNGYLLRQAPCAPLEAGETLDLHTVVYGLDMGCGLAESFYAMLWEHRPHPGQPMKVYCDWGAHDELADEPEPPCLDEAMARRLLADLRRAKEKTGLDFDYYLTDDNWYDPASLYTAFAPGAWKNNAGDFAAALKDAGMTFGVWFDVNLQRMKNKTGAARGGHPEELCMSCPENMRLLFDGVEAQMKNNGVRLLKFDFAFFECDDPAHTDHLHDPVLGKSKAVGLFTEHIARLRRSYPDLRVLLYNGFTTKLDYIGSVDPARHGYAVSPFWCMAADYIYCGDPRPGEWPMPLELSLVHYTDCMVEQFRDSLFPVDALDDHGTMVGVTNTVYYLGKRTLRDSYVMNLARGTKKRHLYGETNLLDDSDWQFMADAEELFSFVCRPECRTVPILDRPSAHGVYGYCSTVGTEGYIAAVNVTAQPRAVSVTPPDGRAADSYRFTVCYADKQWSPAPLGKSGTLAVTLPPFSVSVYRYETVGEVPCQSYISLEPGETCRVPVGNGWLYLRKVRLDFSPQRSSNVGDVVPAVQADNCTLIRQDPVAIWSQISHHRYAVTDAGEDAHVRFINNGGEPVVICWQWTEVSR